MTTIDTAIAAWKAAATQADRDLAAEAIEQHIAHETPEGGDYEAATDELLARLKAEFGPVPVEDLRDPHESREARIEARAAEHVRSGRDEATARRMAEAYVRQQEADAKEEAWTAHLAAGQARIDAAERDRKAAELAAGERALTARLLAQGEEVARIEEACEAEREANLL